MRIQGNLSQTMAMVFKPRQQQKAARWAAFAFCGKEA
jgi:hypothetical protein